jgi:hypothetical protein
MKSPGGINLRSIFSSSLARCLRKKRQKISLGRNKKTNKNKNNKPSCFHTHSYRKCSLSRTLCRISDVRCFGKHKVALCAFNLKPCERIKRRLLEVFSIQFLVYTEANLRWIFGIIVVKTPTVPYVLSKRSIDYPQNVDQNVREPLSS